jgi:hypothetical protein
LSTEQNGRMLMVWLHVWKSPQFQRVYDEFLMQKCQENVNFRSGGTIWRLYLSYSILPVRSGREIGSCI